MPAGKAQGENLAYQVLCRDIIQELRKQEELFPYKDDGIDVPIDMGGTKWYIDVILENSQGELTIVECKKWASTMKQGDIAAFAYIKILLSEKTQKTVKGLYFTHEGTIKGKKQRPYQIGAIEAATFAGIKIGVCEPNQSLTNFGVYFQTYNQALGKYTKDAHHLLTGGMGSKGMCTDVHTRADGTIE
jgi:hypothetical protein